MPNYTVTQRPPGAFPPGGKQSLVPLVTAPGSNPQAHGLQRTHSCARVHVDVCVLTHTRIPFFSYYSLNKVLIESEKYCLWITLVTL